MTEFVGGRHISLEPLVGITANPDRPNGGDDLLTDITLETSTDDVFFDIELDEADELEPDSRYDHIRVSDDVIKDYLRQIGKVPLLTAIDEVELAKTIEAGLFANHRTQTEEDLDPQLAEELRIMTHMGHEAHHRMVTSNLRLVVSVAKKYISKTGGGMDLSELIQEGNIGLHRAVEKFDYKKGFKFSTYATWWIRQAVTRAMADQARTVRLPVHVVEIVNRIRRTSEVLQMRGIDATDEAIAAELDLEPKKVREYRMASRAPISIDAEISDGGGKTPGGVNTALSDLMEDTHTPAPQEVVEGQLLHALVATGLKDSLRDRERFIIMHRYGFDGRPPATLDQIGQMLGVTRERVRQLEVKAIGKLQKNEKLDAVAEAYNFKRKSSE
jgi:RNA polymerase primary sigma factor